MKSVKGMVLCGGEGTRLRPLTYYFQKSMLPVGKKQRPILEYIVRHLSYHGIKDLIFLVDFKSEQIAGYFEDGSRFGVKITYVYDEPELKGTAGSLLNAYRKGYLNTDDTMLVYYGDVLTNLNLRDVINYHREKGGIATLALSRNLEVKAIIVDIDENARIQMFIRKPKLERLNVLSLVVLSGEALKHLEKLMTGKKRLDLMNDVIPHLLDIGERVYGFVTDAFWLDVGSTETYEKLNHDIIDRELTHLFEFR